MIEILTNDGKIRNIDCVILDIVAEIQDDRDVVITMQSEGPCLQHVGLYSLLDKICDQFKFDRQRVLIITPNS